MHTALRVSILAMLVLAVAGAAAAQTYSALLDGSQEVPPVATPAGGAGSFTLDPSKILSFNIHFTGLIGTETGAHIHGPAVPGTNAGVIFALPAGSPKVGTLGPLTPAQEADLNAGLWYVNIHSSFRSGGEIRGQILDTIGVATGTWGEIKALFR